MADWSRYGVNTRRVWEEQSGETLMTFETLPGSVWDPSIQMLALDNLNFLVLAALGFDTFQRLQFDGGG